MPTSYTSLLGLALPTTGELSGTWGTTVNDAITSLLDSAVAGTTTLSTDADVTLTTTDGAANQARSAVLLCSGARTAIRTLTAPAKSKGYVIINATTGGFDVKIVGVGPTTGVLVPAGTRVFVVWNGSDFVKVASSTIAAATDITGVLPTANGGTNLSSFTTNGAMYATSTSALTTGTLPVASGGTGLATLTANNVLLGNGTAAVQVVAPGTAGNVLTSTGSTWSSSPAVSGVANFIRSTKTGAYTLLTGDKGYWIDCTSGTFTLSFTAAATLTNGWWCRISNSGTGNITLDPNASETIDGLTSYVMYPGEVRDVFCTGTAFNTVVITPFRNFLTSGATLTMPPGYTQLGFDLQGGGAGGGGGGSSASTVYGGVGGGGGGRHVGAITAPASNTSITVAVGSGGTGGTGRAAGTGQQSTAGTSGGASTITWSSVVQASADGGYGLATSAGSGLSGANYGGGLVTGDYFYGVSDQPATGWAGAWGTGREANAEYGGGCGLGMGVFVGDSGSSVMGGPAGGGGGSTTSNNGRAGGKKGNFSVGGGGAGGAGGVSGTNGGTATDGGGGGGGFGNGGTPGNGGAGTGYGSGGGGGGASQNTGFAGGNGGAGAAGYACVWGIA